MMLIHRYQTNMELDCIEVRPAEMKVIRHRRTPMDILWDIAHIGKDMIVK